MQCSWLMNFWDTVFDQYVWDLKHLDETRTSLPQQMFVNNNIVSLLWKKCLTWSIPQWLNKSNFGVKDPQSPLHVWPLYEYKYVLIYMSNIFTTISNKAWTKCWQWPMLHVNTTVLSTLIKKKKDLKSSSNIT